MKIRPIIRLKWAAWLTIGMPVATVLALLALIVGSPENAKYIVCDYCTLWMAVITGRPQ